MTKFPIREYILKATNEIGQTIIFTTKALHDSGAIMQLLDCLNDNINWDIKIISNHVV